MTHHVYTTEGFVLGRTRTGEASAYISLYTKDFGLIRATARSVREEKSKLRYSLQDFSYCSVSLVRGRDVWRITGAVEHHSIYHQLNKEPEKLALFVRITRLLQRLVQGEEKNIELFELLQATVSALERSPANTDLLKNLEYIAVLRMLSTLGYIRRSRELEEAFAIPLDISELSRITPLQQRIVGEINRALHESHL